MTTVIELADSYLAAEEKFRQLNSKIMAGEVDEKAAGPEQGRLLDLEKKAVVALAKVPARNLADLKKKARVASVEAEVSLADEYIGELIDSILADIAALDGKDGSQ